MLLVCGLILVLCCVHNLLSESEDLDESNQVEQTMTPDDKGDASRTKLADKVSH